MFSPIPYQGSKRLLAPQILKFFPGNYRFLVEPFVGSGAISIAALGSSHPPTRVIWSDLCVPLISLWNKIVTAPEELGLQYQVLWDKQIHDPKGFYMEVRKKFNADQKSQPHLFLFLLARCAKASVRFNRKGEFNQAPDNRRLGLRSTVMMEHVMDASRLLRGRVSLSVADYREALYGADPLDLVYLDPPYQGVSSTKNPRYVNGLKFEELVASLEVANQRGVSYLLSYDGRTGSKSYGKSLPKELMLQQHELEVGRSAQSTLLGKRERTVESLYVSPALAKRIGI